MSSRPPVEVPPCGCGSPAAVYASICYCSVENLLRIIRRRYALAVLNAIRQHHPARYKTLAAALPGASSSTLAETLGALEAARLVIRRDSDGVPTTCYELSESGTRLLTRLRPLLDDVQR